MTLLQMLSSKHLLYVCWMRGDDGKRGGTQTRGIICADCYVEEGVITRRSQPSLPTVFPHSHSYSHHLPSTMTTLPILLFQTLFSIFPLLGIVSVLNFPVSKSYTFYKVCLKESLLHDTLNKLSKINHFRWNLCYLFL